MTLLRNYTRKERAILAMNFGDNGAGARLLECGNHERMLGGWDLELDRIGVPRQCPKETPFVNELVPELDVTTGSQSTLARVNDSAARAKMINVACRELANRGIKNHW